MSHFLDPVSVSETDLAPVETPSPQRKNVRLSDMFKMLRDDKIPKEVTMSQLQDVFRRL
jgi:hypothetical protein